MQQSERLLTVTRDEELCIVYTNVQEGWEGKSFLICA